MEFLSENRDAVRQCHIKIVGKNDENYTFQHMLTLQYMCMCLHTEHLDKGCCHPVAYTISD